MENYKNFQIGSIVWAYYLINATEEQIQKDIDLFTSYIPLKKAYLENHRGLVDVPVEQMQMAKKVFEKNGIETSGCITSTGFVDERKPSIFDTYCYTTKSHQEAYLKIVEDLASVFDEIILDDYFFISCRCEECIKAKGSKTWSQYRLDLMEDFSKKITSRAKEVNPNMNFIIKYPNWYESWQETGYNPEKQKDIFDMIYSGTETREGIYSQQHLQRYHSYGMVRYMENVAPGRNGGGWIDPFGAEDNMSRWIEQANLTMFAKAKELMLFNFEEMLTNDVFPPLGKELYRVDKLMGLVDNPVGVSLYEPFNGDGEDLLYTYLGMGGVAFEPTPYFDDNKNTIFLTQSASVDPKIMSKVEVFVRNGGNAIVTTGFLRSQYENGIKDLTSLRLTNRYMSGREFLINFRNHVDMDVYKGYEDISFEVLQYKTNATWADVSLINGAYNFPILSEDNYGKGRFFVLNVPENFADYSKLPKEVWAAISKVMSMGQPLYISSSEAVNLFAYDNDIYGIQNYSLRGAYVSVFVRNECKGLEDIETGEQFTNILPRPLPSRWFDGCTVMPEEPEFEIPVKLAPGKFRFFKLLR